MAGLLQSDLPSSDSEDDDFDPTGEKDEDAKKPKAGTKRRYPNRPPDPVLFGGSFYATVPKCAPAFATTLL